MCVRIRLVGRMFELIPNAFETYEQMNGRKSGKFFGFDALHTVNRVFHSAHHIILRRCSRSERVFERINVRLRNRTCTRT